MSRTLAWMQERNRPVFHAEETSRDFAFMVSPAPGNPAMWKASVFDSGGGHHGKVWVIGVRFISADAAKQACCEWEPEDEHDDNGPTLGGVA